ncbi:MAG: helix-turn-helix domain-containing protein [Bacilli bacterium]|nr:helix-turn-helix domain-containing protein [Bacilli bacterium]
MEIGETILKFRKEKGYSQEDLAQVLGVARQTISKWELGETSPDLKQAGEIAKTFEISLDVLVNNKIRTSMIENKKTSNLKIIGGVLYFVILVALILVTIYYLTNKDFTKHYQTEFVCTKEDEKYSVYLEEWKDKYYLFAYGDDNLDKVYVGDTYREAIESLYIIKKSLIDNGAKCK